MSPSLPRLPRASWRRPLRAVGVLLLVLASATPRAWDGSRLERAAERRGPLALASVRLLLPLLRDLSEADELVRLNGVNTFFNRRIVFGEDSAVWGRADYWASPLETLAQGQGDCEDYAIAKYFSLMAAGVPGARLRLVYVQAQIGGPGGALIPHMVLAYYAQPASEPLILDNLVTEVRAASRRPDLLPVFSFNTEGLWQGASGPNAGDASVRLSRWRELLTKAREEGFL